MAGQPDVTFIICTYNRSSYLDDTLQSLLQSEPSNLPFELLIIDNNSDDTTQEVVQKKQETISSIKLKYIKEQKQGLSHARNRGINEAAAPNVVFLDDDIRATERLIPAWLSFFENHPEVAAAGGKIDVQFDDPRPDWMSHFLLPLLAYQNLGNSIKVYLPNKYPFGCNMGFKKSIFDEIEKFDTSLGRKGKCLNAGEEKEIFKRIRDRGNNIYYLPEALLFHRIGAERLTIDYIRKQARGLGQSMKLQLEEESTLKILLNGLSEIGKFFASVPLALFYLIKLQPSKATMLFKFRWWIWKGYNRI